MLTTNFKVFIIRQINYWSSIQIDGINTFCPLGYFGLGGISTSKLRQEKLTKFIKILNYIKFLCIIFVANCPNIPNIYYSQKELNYVGLEILVIHGILEHVVLNIFK